MKDDKIFWIWFGMISNRIGAARARKLLGIYRYPSVIWELKRIDLAKTAMMSEKLIALLTDKTLKYDAEVCFKKTGEIPVNVMTIYDEDYPERLKHIPDSPIVLYVKGKLSGDERCIAVVGARNASQYGLDTAERISFELSRLDITVSSGMARGIDSRAHRGALKAGGRTIAVLGCGIDVAYPAENSGLMEKISQSGAVVSEYPLGAPPLPFNFPLRNRIISGISMGVVVVEANERSGSLITADFALDQGREVFAVPGNVNSAYSRGTNKLIKDGAKIITDISDILEEIPYFETHMDKPLLGFIENSGGIQVKGSEKAGYEDLDDEEKNILAHIGNDAVSIDILTDKCGQSVQYLNSLLLMMEMKGILKQLPGKIFMIKE